MYKYLKLMSSATFFSSLFELDSKIALETAENSTCKRCGCTNFYFDNYNRKPRGIQVLNHVETVCYSLRCRNCRKRIRAESLRFLGRKVYISLFVVIIPAFARGDYATVIAFLKDNKISLSFQTIKRWLNWWSNYFKETCTWKKLAGFFLPQSTTTNNVAPPGIFFEIITVNGTEETIIKILNLIRGLRSELA